MQIDAAAFDISGTLIGHNSYGISEEAAAGLKRIEGCGIKIILVSGFTEEYMREFAKGIGIKAHIVSSTYNKGKMLREAAAGLGIEKERIISVGDGYEDILMFMESGSCVVVGKGKRAADVFDHAKKCGVGAVRMDDAEGAIGYIIEAAGCKTILRI
jgi:hydroxymethylpyrimidine pyrophosphatase-like HAD family hydrolase